MAELSTKRSNFYKQIYFPSTYYREVFDITLEEAKTTQEARNELLKLQIEADKNLADLAETYRPARGLSPADQIKLSDAEKTVREDERSRAAADSKRSAFAANPGKATLNQIKLDMQAADAAAGGKGLSSSEKQAIVDAATKSALAGQPDAVKRQIYLAVEASGQKPSLILIQNATNTPDLTLASVKGKAASPEDKAAMAAFAKSGGGKPSPAAVSAQRDIDANKSPYLDGSLETDGHIASGISGEEDYLLREYLKRLQDKESPGIVTEDEIAEDPNLAQGEAVWKKVSAAGSALKTSSEWFASEYLAALQTRDQIEKKIEKDPFDGLGAYGWSQREALKRGGYTKESLLHLSMLEDRPDIAPYVGPAFTRLRAEGGVEPKTPTEAIIQEALKQNPKLAVAELESLLGEKRQEQIAQGRVAARGARQDARGAALAMPTIEGVDKVTAQREAKAAGRAQGRDLRQTAREAGNSYVPDAEGMEDAKAYLLALRLNRAGTPATPDVGTKIEIPVTKTPSAPTAADVAGAAVNRAAAAAKPAEDVPTPAAPTEQDLEALAVERAKIKAGLAAQKEALAKKVATPEAPRVNAATQGLLDTLGGKPPARPSAAKPSPAPASPAPAPARKKIDLGLTEFPAPSPAPVATPVDQAAQLRALLKSGSIPRGTAQYDAALQRLDEIEGVQ